MPTATLPSAAAQAASAPADKPSSAASSDWDFSFHNLLDIINPLQHLPVIGTIYRAITGDHMGVPEKIAGDTLYGGMWGAVSAVADTAFEAITGKDFGATVLALFTGSGKSAQPMLAAAPTSDALALTAAVERDGADADLAARAMAAYRKRAVQPFLHPSVIVAG